MVYCHSLMFYLFLVLLTNSSVIYCIISFLMHIVLVEYIFSLTICVTNKLIDHKYILL